MRTDRCGGRHYMLIPGGWGLGRLDSPRPRGRTLPPPNRQTLLNTLPSSLAVGNKLHFIYVYSHKYLLSFLHPKIESKAHLISPHTSDAV